MKSYFKRIGIVMALQKEAAPVIKKLNLTPQISKNPKLPIQLFSGSFGKIEICLALNGQDNRYQVDLIGSQVAVLTTNYIAEHFAPDLIVSAGTAGGLKSHGAEIGDVYLSKDRVRFHDRRTPVPGFRESGLGDYPSWDASKLSGFKFGRVSSGDSLYMSSDEAEMFAANAADIKDMESAGVAWVANLYGVPFLAVKVITDLLDHPSKVEDRFVDNLQIATHQLSVRLCELLQKF